MVQLIDKTGPVIEQITNKEYIGRMIMIGETKHHNVVAYFPTGRSAGSKARYLTLDEQTGTVVIDPSKDAKPGQGNPALIYYNAIRLLNNGGIVVTNGVQTDLIVDTYEKLGDRGLLSSVLLHEAFKQPFMMNNFYRDKKTGEMKFERIDITSFEPDAPNFTPRISGVLDRRSGGTMHMAFNEGGELKREDYTINHVSWGTARCLATYTGQNVPDGVVIPHFVGQPFEIPIVGETAEDFAHAIDNSLGPKEGEDVVKKSEDKGGNDFRVGVAVIFRDKRTHTLDYHIINHHEPASEELKRELLGGK